MREAELRDSYYVASSGSRLEAGVDAPNGLGRILPPLTQSGVAWSSLGHASPAMLPNMRQTLQELGTV